MLPALQAQGPHDRIYGGPRRAARRVVGRRRDFGGVGGTGGRPGSQHPNAYSFSACSKSSNTIGGQGVPRFATYSRALRCPSNMNWTSCTGLPREASGHPLGCRCR